MSIPDGHEAYIEVQAAWGRLIGGTLAEVSEFWNNTKHHSANGCRSRLVVGDVVVEERGIGSEALRHRIEEMAELLGLNVGEQDL